MGEEVNENSTKRRLSDLVCEADRKVHLEPPLLITEEMAQKNLKYKWLQEAYREADEIKVEKQMAISLINHFVSHNKVVVQISKNILEKLVLEDENWEIKKPFSEKTYNAACAILSELNIKRIAWASKHRLAVVFSFPNSPTFEHYTGNLDEDLEQMFKMNKTSLSDFQVDEYRECFSKYIDN